MTTRSTTLATASIPVGTFVVVYACPVGTIALIKDIRSTQAPAQGVQIDALVSRPSRSVMTYLFQGVPTNSLAYSWTGWVVLEPGDELQIFAAVQAATVWVSGAALIDT